MNEMEKAKKIISVEVRRSEGMPTPCYIRNSKYYSHEMLLVLYVLTHVLR